MVGLQGKAMLNKAWRPRWCSLKGAKFEYFEDHTKRKALGVVPLELASWERAANHALVLHTVGREGKAGELSGRAFYFRFLGDSDREGFFAALRRAAYLRHRQVFLEACRVGDAYSVHQVGDSLSLSLFLSSFRAHWSFACWRRCCTGCA
jgi:hypothetical protein